MKKALWFMMILFFAVTANADSLNIGGDVKSCVVEVVLEPCVIPAGDGSGAVGPQGPKGDKGDQGPAGDYIPPAGGGDPIPPVDPVPPIDDPLPPVDPPSGDTPFLTGFNLAVAEFGKNVPGQMWSDYGYPSTKQADEWMSKGFNSFRIPFKWLRLQRSLYGELHGPDLKELKKVTNHIVGKGGYVILDSHDYGGREKYKKVGRDIDRAAFADYWAKMASVPDFRNEQVLFDLSNEPTEIDPITNRDNMQAAINAIRSTGANNMIAVAGTNWSGCHSWVKSGQGNAGALQSITDPADNVVFTCHQYPDSNSSGTSSSCVSDSVLVDRVKGFTKWARDNGFKGYLGEFGVGDNSTCYKALNALLKYMRVNQDVWQGWSFWASGPWWNKNYHYRLVPDESDQRIDILEKYAK